MVRMEPACSILAAAQCELQVTLPPAQLPLVLIWKPLAPVCEVPGLLDVTKDASEPLHETVVAWNDVWIGVSPPPNETCTGMPSRHRGNTTVAVK